jgi:hypothetical protein
MTTDERVQRALAVRRETAIVNGALQLGSLEQALEWGKMIIDSRLAPRGFERASQVVWCVQKGRELGLGPATSLDAFYMTPEGKPALYAEAAWAIVLASGNVSDWDEESGGTGLDAWHTFKVLRRGDKRWRLATFSQREAVAAGLVKPRSGWEKWPQRMRRARSLAFLLHDVFPDLLKGLRIEGEIDEVELDAGGPEAAPPASPARRAGEGRVVSDPLLDDDAPAAAPATEDVPAVPIEDVLTDDDLTPEIVETPGGHLVDDGERPAVRPPSDDPARDDAGHARATRKGAAKQMDRALWDDEEGE